MPLLLHVTVCMTHFDVNAKKLYTPSSTEAFTVHKFKYKTPHFWGSN